MPLRLTIVVGSNMKLATENGFVSNFCFKGSVVLATNVVLYTRCVTFSKLKNDLLIVSIWFLCSVGVVRCMTKTDTSRISATIFKDSQHRHENTGGQVRRQAESPHDNYRRTDPDQRVRFTERQEWDSHLRATERIRSQQRFPPRPFDRHPEHNPSCSSQSRSFHSQTKHQSAVDSDHEGSFPFTPTWNRGIDGYKKHQTYPSPERTSYGNASTGHG